MARISRQRLSAKMWRSLWGQLLGVMAENDEQAIDVYLRRFLSETEQNMLAKRLMVALLFYWDWSVVQTATFLNLSTATVYKLVETYRGDDNLRRQLLMRCPGRLEPPKRRSTKAIAKLDELAEFVDDFLASYRKRSRLTDVR